MLFRLSDVYKSYSGTEILRGLSFQVNPDEKVGLVGRNGAGKTTVFRLITGEESADSGDVFKTGNLKIGLLEQHVDFTANETVHTAALSAFQKLHDIEAEMRRLELLMAENPEPEILERYAELQTEFEHEDGFTYTSRAEAILMGLGFGTETWNNPTVNLSGGQKNRLGLARLLLSNPDILLLDEPTNHLDVGAVEWLEEFLQKFEKSFVIISHDRYFLDRTCRKIIEIENGSAYSYVGNYSRYLTERALRREQQQREFENQQAFINKTEAFIRKNLAGQKTKQAKSRRNLLERMDRIDQVTTEKAAGNYRIKEVERAGSNVLKVEELSVGYGEKILGKDINFTLHRGECLGIIGGNGTGKTTFLKTILGQIRELHGQLVWGSKTRIGYYSQQLEDLDDRNEIITELRRVAPTADNGELRSFLAGFLFFGEDVFKQVSTLSGGEKGRLALAKLIYSNFNVLALDEPTNHLDIPSREALEEALKNYPGTILTVSHDRYFLDQIATQIFSFQEAGEIEMFYGNYTEFHRWQESESKREKEAGQFEDEISPPEAEKIKDTGAAPAISKNELKKKRGRIASIEDSIPKLESDLAKLAIRMNDQTVVSNQLEFKVLSENYQKTEQKIQALYAEWEDLLAELPEIGDE